MGVFDEMRAEASGPPVEPTPSPFDAMRAEAAATATPEPEAVAESPFAAMRAEAVEQPSAAPEPEAVAESPFAAMRAEAVEQPSAAPLSLQVGQSIEEYQTARQDEASLKEAMGVGAVSPATAHGELLRIQKEDKEKQQAVAVATKLDDRKAMRSIVGEVNKTLAKASKSVSVALAEASSPEEEQRIRNAHSQVTAELVRAKTMAMAEYSLKYGPQGERPHVSAAAEGRLVQEQPGGKGPLGYAFDLLDIAADFITRPLYSAGSEVADVDHFESLQKKDPDGWVETALDWASRLHPDDTRPYERLFAAMEGQRQLNESTGLSMLGLDFKPPDSVEFQAAKAALRRSYYAPGEEDPYGGTGTPRPWQALDERGRPLADEPPAEVVDIYMRALSKQIPGSAIEGDMLPMLHKEMQRVFGTHQGFLMESIKHPLRGPRANLLTAILEVDAAINPSHRGASYVLSPEDMADATPEELEAAELAAKMGEVDNKKGMFIHDLLATTLVGLPSPRSAVGLLFDPAGKALKGRRTAAGILTPEGDQLLRMQGNARADELLDARQKSLGRELTPDEAAATAVAVDSKVNAAFLHAGAEAAKKGEGVRLIDTSRAITLSETGEVMLDYGKVSYTAAAAGEATAIAPARTPLGQLGSDVIRGVIQLAPDSVAKPLAYAADIPRRALNLGRRRPFISHAPTFVVQDGKKWRVARPSDAVDDHKWEAVLQALGRHRSEVSRVKAEADAAAFELWHTGAVTKEQDRLLQRFSEALPNPSDEGPIGARLMAQTQAALSDAVKTIPLEHIQKEASLGERRVRDAQKATRAAFDAHGAAMRGVTAAGSDLASSQRALADADKALQEAEAAMAASGSKSVGTDAGDAMAEANRAVVEAKKARKVAMMWVIAATKKAKKARGTADEVAARLAKSEAARDAARAQADAFAADIRLKEAQKAGPAAGPSAGGPSSAERAAHDAAQKSARDAEAHAASAKQAYEKARRAVDAADQDVRDAMAKADAATAGDVAAVDRLQRAEEIHLPKRGLLDEVLGVVEGNIAQARAAKAILEDATGFPTLEAYKAAQVQRDALDAAIKLADETLADGDISKAFATMTVSDARQMERAANRYGGSAAEARRAYAKLSPGQQAAVERLRGLYNSWFDRFKAEGKIPQGWALEDFYEHMRVEGYTRHVLTQKGMKSAERARPGFSTELPMLKKRGKPGITEEINEHAREDVARMFLKERVGEDAEHLWNHPTLIAREIRQQGLDKIKYFDTDAVKLYREYAHQAGTGLANDRLVMRLTDIFPEGGELAAAAADPAIRVTMGFSATTPIDVIAEGMGFTRLPGATRQKLTFGQAVWPGWAKYKEEIGLILRNDDTASRNRKLLAIMDREGVPAGDLVRKQVEILAADVFLPAVVVQELRHLSEAPEMLKSLKKALGASGFDEYLAFWKMSVTIGAAAFHGRNFISNSLQTAMKHGVASLAPSNQMKFHEMTMAEAGQDVRLVLDDGTIEVMDGPSWVRHLRDIGVDSVRVGPADTERSLRDLRVDIPGGLKRGAMSAALGSIIGGITGPKEEGEFFSSRGAFGGAMVGGMGGMTIGGLHDIYLKGRVGLARKEARLSLGEASNAVMGDIMAGALAASKVGIWTGMLGGTSGAAGSAPGSEWLGEASLDPRKWIGGKGKAALKGAALGAAGGAGLKMVSEGFFAMGGGVGQAIERQARGSTYVHLRKKGWSHSAAAREVNETFFDYDDLTQLERHGLKRLIPFWVWASRNVGLQLKLLATRPREYQAMNKLVMALQRPVLEEGDLQFAPEYLRYRIVVNTSLGKMVAGFGTPQEALVELSKGPGPMLHPLLLFGQKLVTGKDPFYQTDMLNVLGARDVRHLPGFTGLPEYVGYRTYMDRGKEKHEVGWWKNPDGTWRDQDRRKGSYRMAMLRSFPAWRLVSEGNKAVTDTFMQGSNATSGDAQAESMERFLALTTGLRPYAVVVGRWKEQAWRDMEERLFQDLINGGLTSEVAYIKRMRLENLPDDEQRLLLNQMGLGPREGVTLPASQ